MEERITMAFRGNQTIEKCKAPGLSLIVHMGQPNPILDDRQSLPKYEHCFVVWTGQRAAVEKLTATSPWTKMFKFSDLNPGV
jgi:hypothetical protein